jgi:hypothetical protein
MRTRATQHLCECAGPLVQEHGILWGGGGNWQSWVDEWDALEELKRKGQDKATLALIGTVQVLLLLPVSKLPCIQR